MCPNFFECHALLPWEKFLLQLQQWYFIFCRVVAATYKVLRYVCITLIVEVICANWNITAYFDLARTELACDSTYISYIWFCINCTISFDESSTLWCSSGGGGGRYAINLLYRHSVPPFTWGGYCYLLLSVWSVKESIEVFPSLEFGGLLAPLTYVIVKHRRLRQ